VIIRLLILAILAAALAAGGYYAVQELYIKPEQRLQADRRLPAPAPPPDPSVVEYERCMELWKRGAPPSEARAAFERLLKEFPETRKRRDALDAIGQINSQEFFTQTPNETNLYVVNPGDSLSRVSNRRKLPIELILYLNKLPSENLHFVYTCSRKPGSSFSTMARSSSASIPRSPGRERTRRLSSFGPRKLEK
jgi:hypothetical protein